MPLSGHAAHLVVSRKGTQGIAPADDRAGESGHSAALASRGGLYIPGVPTVQHGAHLAPADDPSGAIVFRCDRAGVAAVPYRSFDIGSGVREELVVLDVQVLFRV